MGSPPVIAAEQAGRQPEIFLNPARALVLAGGSGVWPGRQGSSRRQCAAHRDQKNHVQLRTIVPFRKNSDRIASGSSAIQGPSPILILASLPESGG